MTPGERLRIGIIGCGDVANFAGLCFSLNRSVKMVRCCDSNPERAQAFAHKYRLEEGVSDYQTLFSKGNLDAVYIAAPHFLHHEMILSAIRAGIHVLCEKPITITLEDARDIVLQAQERGIKVGINYQYRYDAALNQLFRQVRWGRLGEIRYVRLNIPWHREKDYISGWRGDKSQSGGGTLITQGSHALDFALWICGSRPLKATGIARNSVFDAPVEDLGMGMIELENGVVIQICSAMIATPERAVSAEFYTSQGTVIYRNKPFPILSSNIVLPPDFSFLRKGVFAFQRSINAFIDWLLEKEGYLIPAGEAVPALASVLTLYASSTSGRVEAIDY